MVSISNYMKTSIVYKTDANLKLYPRHTSTSKGIWKFLDSEWIWSWKILMMQIQRKCLYPIKALTFSRLEFTRSANKTIDSLVNK